MGDVTHLTPNTDESIDFLVHWSEAPWTLVAIKPKEQKYERDNTRAKAFDDAEHMRTWIDQYNGHWNIYFVPNECEPSITTSPGKAEMTAVRCYHLDLDLPKDASELTDDMRDELLGRLHQFEPRPRVILFSGGGFQAFWRWKESKPANEFADRVETDNKYILQQVGGDGSCWNVNRLMRLPGTINVLTLRKRERGRQPALARVVESNWGDPLYEFGKERLPHVPEIESTSIPNEAGDDAESALTQAEAAEEGTIESLSAKLQKAITKGDASKHGGDRSKLVWYIVCSLARHNWSDESITAVLLNREFGCSAHVLDQSNPTAYAERQVRQARAEVATQWRRNDKGQILAGDWHNIRKAIRELGARLGYNDFNGREYINGAGPLRILDPIESIDLRGRINDKFGFLPAKEHWRDCLKYDATRTRWNPVRKFLDENEPRWDGTKRIGGNNPDDPPSWLTTYGGATDSEYVRAIGRLTLIAAVRRVRQPGCKHDEMLVLISAKQGTNKSSALAVLAVKYEWFSDSFPLHAKDKQIIEQLQGKWIIECGELAGIKQADIETTKALLSRQTDRARLAYDDVTTEWHRQCIFIGSTNNEQYLRDVENRRFWSVSIVRFDLDALKQDVLQIWAEAAHYESQGESIILPEDLWQVAAEVQEEHTGEDPWAGELNLAIGDREGRIMGTDVWKIIQKNVANRLYTDAARLADVMKKLGWRNKVHRFPGLSSPQRCYVKGNEKITLYVTFDEHNGQAIVSEAPNPADYEDRENTSNAVQNREAPF